MNHGKRQIGWRRGLWLVQVSVLTLVFLSGAGLFQRAAASNTPWGQGLSKGEDLVISLATFGPGDEVPAWFGHTGIVVEDRRYNVGSLYNYGMFSFDRAMLMKFAMGRLWFWVAPTHVGGTYDLYMRMDRDVRVLELNLPPEKRLEVARVLAENVRPENREYLYHHYFDNCSTRVRDIIDIAVDGQFSAALGDKLGRWTLREHTRRHSAHFPPMDWLLMFLMNHDIDRPSTVWDEMFLPEELERQVLNFEWIDEDGQAQPLVLREHIIYESEARAPVPEVPPTQWPLWLLVGLILGGLGLFIGYRGRRRPGRGSRISYGLYHGAVGLLIGIPGTVLATMALVTDHTVTYWNQNLFWANPATFVVFILAIAVLCGRWWARKGLVILWTGLSILALLGGLLQLIGLLIPYFYQDTSLAMALFLPTIFGATLGAWWVDGARVREELRSGRGQ